MRGQLARTPVGLRVVGAALAWLVLAPAAAGHDHRPPGATIRSPSGDGPQHGLGYETGWTSPSGRDACVGMTGHGPYRWTSDAASLTVGSPIALTFLKLHRPDEVHVDVWRALDPQGRPVGEPVHPEIDLVPVVREGERRGWRASWTADPLPGDIYVDAFVRWRDRDGCGGDQWMGWTFHMDAAPAA